MKTTLYKPPKKRHYMGGQIKNNNPQEEKNAENHEKPTILPTKPTSYIIENRRFLVKPQFKEPVLTNKNETLGEILLKIIIEKSQK